MYIHRNIKLSQKKLWNDTISYSRKIMNRLGSSLSYLSLMYHAETLSLKKILFDKKIFWCYRSIQDRHLWEVWIEYDLDITIHCDMITIHCDMNIINDQIKLAKFSIPSTLSKNNKAIIYTNNYSIIYNRQSNSYRSNYNYRHLIYQPMRNNWNISHSGEYISW